MAASYVMPIPNTAEAPKFDGHYIADFLEDISMHLARVQVTDEDVQIGWILRYCTPAVRDRIRFLPEMDRDTTGKTWAQAKTALLELYGDIDKPKPLPLAEFLKRVQELADKPAYTTKAQVNEFYTQYTSLAQPLLKSNMISDNDFKFHFIQAIPSTMKPAIRVLIPQSNLTRANAPEAKIILGYLRSLADKDDPTYESWRYDESKAQEIMLLQPSASSSQPASSNAPASAAKSLTSDDRMDELVEKMENLRLLFAQGQRPANIPANPGLQQQRPLRCVMCGQAPPTHVIGFRNCPELANLVNEGRVRLDPMTNRYVMSADGSDLPRAPNGHPGGVAAYIRSLTPTPPTTRVAGAAHAAVIFPDGSTFATLTASHIAGSDPKLRSGKEYDASGRYDPKKRPDDKPSARQRAQPPPQPSGSSAPQPGPSTGPAGPSTPMQTPAAPPAPTAPSPSPPVASPPTSAPPVPPINREEGWKQSLPKNKGKEREHDPDVIMKDTAPKPRDKDKSTPTTGYRNMSELESSVDVQCVYETVLGQTAISLPLRDLLGIAPGLLDRIHEATRRKRVPKNQTAQTSVIESDGVPIVVAVPAAASPLRGATLINTDSEDHDQQIAQAFFAGQGSPSVRDRFLAMSVGVLSGTICGIQFRLMIDSGSELNLGDNSVPDRTQLPLDYLGSSWSLRGIQGGPEQLLGYLSNAPIFIGGHEFADHLFISPNDSIGETFSIILGQPFLTHYSARLDYSPSGRSMLYLWTRQDKERGARPTVGIAITLPNDPRNREIPSHSASYVSPYIEEITDEDVISQVFPVRALAASEPASPPSEL
ncbi:hypothetical protein GSI_06870 [Ganoderma sinense ZZ0214-1]|uniref:DUF4100 domain-containing protein n=1 Tax=Ganoderma sinense ZZ0214-1 TaxID=1077348 RepID=A0A2G8SAB8_9APHY|nr:hypothetical protein GSI_06870 [Ganoderma sinense ZZ0214-1]